MHAHNLTIFINTLSSSSLFFLSYLYNHPSMKMSLWCLSSTLFITFPFRAHHGGNEDQKVLGGASSSLLYVHTNWACVVGSTKVRRQSRHQMERAASIFRALSMSRRHMVSLCAPPHVFLSHSTWRVVCLVWTTEEAESLWLKAADNDKAGLWTSDFQARAPQPAALYVVSNLEHEPLQMWDTDSPQN